MSVAKPMSIAPSPTTVPLNIELSPDVNAPPIFQYTLQAEA